MQALVTGASGFVGANIVAALNQAGWQVRTLLRSTSSRAALEGLSYQPVMGDVTDRKSLAAAMQGVDAVFHAAGVVADYWSQDAALTYRVNVNGTRNVVEAALAAAPRPRLVFTSSQAALGFGAGQAMLDESHTFNIAPAIYPYGHSKHLAEQVVQGAVRAGLHAVIVNPSIVLGPRDVTLYNSQILLNIQARRLPLVPPGGINVVDALDVATGHLLALDKGRPGQRYLLVGHNVTLFYLASQIAASLGVRGPRGVLPDPLIGPLAAALDQANRLSPRRLPLAGDVLRFGSRFFYASNAKAKAELGWQVTPLEETIERAIAWLRATGALTPG
ncbi:MAG TPA: SDR family NAD(P)-dependent oxidoreductase [Anaerolineae bacterium]|nr:SDR family NAD(P)-dependent oxidoreductase [Anaerolineae bacterium]HNU02778.1 SDR family NAD(P)-dependent oxidoreductase [Anaerolineae bacterium]